MIIKSYTSEELQLRVFTRKSKNFQTSLIHWPESQIPKAALWKRRKQVMNWPLKKKKLKKKLGSENCGFTPLKKPNV